MTFKPCYLIAAYSSVIHLGIIPYCYCKACIGDAFRLNRLVSVVDPLLGVCLEPSYFMMLIIDPCGVGPK